jgi:8-amino-3,8-dideoxy-alpha-D-manno-octulosonate transaminase
MKVEELAVNGGVPVRNEPLPACHPGGMAIDEMERSAVLEILDASAEGGALVRYGLQGKWVERFEHRFASYMGVSRALAMSSGTGALMAALAGLGLGEPGDEVIVPSYTWIATMGAVVALNATPVIAEVDDSLTLDPEDLEAKITERTRAIIPVHMRGVPCDMDRIMSVAERHGLPVIEDVAQACGGTFRGRRLGTFGVAGMFSLQENKVITCGEGGVLITDDEALYQRAAAYSDHGFSPPRDFMRITEHTILGIKLAMGEIQGAMAYHQVDKLDGLLARMRANKKLLRGLLDDLPGLSLQRIPDIDGDVGQYLILFLPDERSAREFADALYAENIYARSPEIPMLLKDETWHWLPNMRHLIEERQVASTGPPFKDASVPSQASRYSPEMVPKSASFVNRAVRLDLSPELSERDIEDISTGVRKIRDALL